MVPLLVAVLVVACTTAKTASPAENYPGAIVFVEGVVPRLVCMVRAGETFAHCLYLDSVERTQVAKEELPVVVALEQALYSPVVSMLVARKSLRL